jgi:hypothetical protein
MRRCDESDPGLAVGNREKVSEVTEKSLYVVLDSAGKNSVDDTRWKLRLDVP